ncbi:MAG: sigma 54-interacting transcriptional regulator [Polyangiales bacterium]
MTPTKTRVPWSELTALAAGCLAVATLRVAGRAPTPEDAAVALLAMAVAWGPRYALESTAPAFADAAGFAGLAGSLAVATSAAGRVPPTTALRVAHAASVGVLLAFASLLALALPLRADTIRRALAPSVLLGAACAVGVWSPLGYVPGVPDLRALAPVAGLAVALLYAHAVRRPFAPLDRARLVAPGLGAAALALALTVVTFAGRRVSPLVLAVGVAAQVAGVTLGTGAIALEHAARLARRTAAGALGLFAGAAVTPLAPDAGAPVGTLTMLLAWPWLERELRPDGGRLLDACDEIDRGLRRAGTLADLATAVLDPLRLASRNLRAPAALWVLDRRESLRIDVTGAAATAPLSLEGERAILSWLRARPGALFADTLRPYQVRRPELRPVVAALDAHGCFGALPLVEEGELVGVILLPRGARRDAATYEEEVRLAEVARATAGALSLLEAVARGHERESAALRRAASLEEARASLEAANRHAAERERGARSLRAVGSLEEAWVGYAAATRALGERLDAAAAGDAPVCLVAEPGAGAVAAARRLHGASARRAGPFAVVDASRVAARDALATLVGDARVEPVRPGWFEHADGGTLVVEDAAALGHDALVALLSCARDREARRLGATAPYPCDVRVVLVTRRPPGELDLPAALAARLGATLQVPPLRARAEDVESLALLAVDRACRALGVATVGLSAEALSALRAYPWPGNLPELFDAVERAVARTRSARVPLDALPPQVRGAVSYAARDDRDDRDDDDDEGRPLDDA